MPTYYHKNGEQHKHGQSTIIRSDFAFFRQCDIFIFHFSSDKNVKKSMVFDGDQNKYISNLLQSNIEHKITTLYGMK